MLETMFCQGNAAPKKKPRPSWPGQIIREIRENERSLAGLALTKRHDLVIEAVRLEVCEEHHKGQVFLNYVDSFGSFFDPRPVHLLVASDA